ncbi:lipoyl synthase [Sedimenticola selenatireducens]|uniref:Lipoyl synthase n=1 Tax=Sedimenticola selenatireducens TaxID=191960 RepID=A0A2N6CTI1_9GAMM|nr:lipoyl synthase [Sedimenticola selenatireducens]PLX60477.1 MAG: lipoyl synthase [Sedimenticola selenatireducens]
MSKAEDHNAPSRATPETHQRGSEKLARIPVKVEPTRVMPRKPDWIRVKMPSGERVNQIKQILRQSKLSSVCEEAACPNLGECFSHGTATFMIMGDICTRRCPFCDVAHGKPLPLDPHEPAALAEAVKAMQLRYVVVTSVDRDDLRDGGAGHFVDCITALRGSNPDTRIEILVPDFRGRIDVALEAFAETQPDVFNHNLETIPRLYRQARPGADYQGSLDLLARFKQRHPDVQTKSGLMLGLGETTDEVLTVMQDLREHQVNMLTLGQYLQPSRDHLPVDRFVTPREFDDLRRQGEAMGFANVASGPLVRSSYHADLQANPLLDRDSQE